ncbi:MAG TPA: hypothetical protein PKA39_12070 [Ignavibacteria bacterium]|nr:hypothetical protein [Ignavibacteria bacterium]
MIETRDSRFRGNDKTGGPIAYTDYIVMNDGTLEEMNEELKKFA